MLTASNIAPNISWL